MAKYNYTNDASETFKQIDTIIRSARNVEANVRRVMISCVLVALEHRNTQPATKLCEELSTLKTIRTNAIREWFELNGPFVWDKGTTDKANKSKGVFKLNKDVHKKLAKELETVGLAKFCATLTAVDIKKEPEYQGFNLKDKINAILNQAVRIQKDETKLNDERTDLTGLFEIKKAVSMIGTEEVTPDMEELQGEMLS